MAIDIAAPRSRRALLTAGVGAVSATVAAGIDRPLPVQATNGGSIVLGTWPTNFNGTGTNEASASTYIYSSSGGGLWARASVGDGLMGWADSTSGAYTGVFGESDSVIGVGTRGIAMSNTGKTMGVLGNVVSPDGTGVMGCSSGLPAFPVPAPLTGVFGYATSATTAVGVRGESPEGTGILATSKTGTALRVTGKAKFSRSGRASVRAGRKYVDVTVPGGLASNSVVHATLQTYRAGVAIAAARKNFPSAGKVRIYLTKIGSRTAGTSVGWWVAES